MPRAKHVRVQYKEIFTPDSAGNYRGCRFQIAGSQFVITSTTTYAGANGAKRAARKLCEDFGLNIASEREDESTDGDYIV